MAIAKDYPGEQWKTVQFEMEFVNNFRLEVSNFGRMRTFNKISNGNLINGSMINGYKILRIKLLKPREKKTQKELEGLRKQVLNLSTQLRHAETKAIATGIKAELTEVKKVLARKAKADDKKRKIYYQSLVHRLIATYFLRKRTEQQVVVAHLDFNKLNNRANNLKWMTLEENYAHQRLSPSVIAEKQERMAARRQSNTTKLTVTKVMLLKKLLNQNKPVKALAKQFRVTDTQIIRIRKGINWADVKAAT